jgi:3-oxoacyl-[acyl-carrier-protein] synthase-3
MAAIAPAGQLGRMVALRDAFITGTGIFLPGEPVGNDRMEDFIGRVGGRSSVVGQRALRWNGIESRHYALTPEGDILHSNASMSAAAVMASLQDAGLGREHLQMLATATTQGDDLVPGHASAVHGELGGGALELASFQSVCASSVMAVKAATLSVRAGDTDCASAVAGEFSSRWFRPSFYEGTALLDAKGRLPMQADFLRWTLSDGAGAVVVEPKPRSDQACLRIEWIDLTSLAGRFDACMWAGAAQDARGELKSAWSHAGPRDAHAAGAIALLQDFALLKVIIRAWLGVYLEKVDQARIDPDRVDWLLCHYSARSLREEIVDLLKRTNAMIPESKWFTTLPRTGNVGSASIWVMLDALLKSGSVKSGERILCVVPESGRAMVGFMMLEMVA